MHCLKHFARIAIPVLHFTYSSHFISVFVFISSDQKKYGNFWPILDVGKLKLITVRCDRLLA